LGIPVQAFVKKRAVAVEEKNFEVVENKECFEQMDQPLERVAVVVVGIPEVAPDTHNFEGDNSVGFEKVLAHQLPLHPYRERHNHTLGKAGAVDFFCDEKN
jgi:hypothetical protein